MFLLFSSSHNKPPKVFLSNFRGSSQSRCCFFFLSVLEVNNYKKILYPNLFRFLFVGIGFYDYICGNDFITLSLV